MKRYYAFLLILAVALTANGQLLNETFDSAAGFSITDGNDAAATFFSDGSGDYFGIIDIAGALDDFGAGSEPSGDENYTGFDNFYLINEDMDGDGTVIPYTLTWTSIALSGETNLEISADFASTRADGDDYILVSYRVDTGAWTPILGVGGESGVFNGPVYEITNFSGISGDPSATAMSIAATTISNTFTLGGTESTLEIKAEFSNNNGDDNFAMDNLVVQELTGIQPPTGLSAAPSASPNNKDSLDVSFTPDGSSDVLLAYSTTDSFGAPVDTITYSAGDPLPGGGTVAGDFSLSPAQISGLVPGTLYYIAAFSVDGSDNYSSASPSFTGTTDTFALQVSGFGAWTAFSVASSNDWSVGSDTASASGFGGDAPAEDWLISPELDLDSTIDETFEFTYEDNFSDSITGLEVFYTTLYTGDPTTTTWIPFTALNTELDDYVASGSGAVDTAVDLSGIGGTTVQLAFKYTCTGTAGGQSRNWTVSDPLISGNNASDPTITLSATPTTVAEGAVLAVTLTVSSTVGADTEFFLSSNGDGSELSFPASVTVLDGTNSIGFNVNGLTDGLLDGDILVSLIGNAAGYTLGTLDVTVTDIDAPVPTGDIIFTQYYEGSGNNKWVEITNIGSSSVTLTGYEVTTWSNANAEAWKTDGGTPDYTLDLSSVTLAAGQSYVIANPSAVLPFSSSLADVTSDITFFNGDDSLVLFSDATGYLAANIVDAIGFTDAGNEGAEKGWVRSQAVVGYDLISGSTIEDYDDDSSGPAIWTEITIATADSAVFGDDAFLGTTGLATPPAIVSFTSSSQYVLENDGSFDLDVQITGLTSGIVIVDVTFNSGSSTADGSDITFTSPTQLTFDASSLVSPQTITVPIIDDGLDAGLIEVASFDLSISSGTAIVGSPSTQDVRIQDSDVVIPDLIISEVADPNDNASARFVELFNPTGSAIDLSADTWNLTRFVNDNPSGNNVALTGTIPAGGTYVIAGDATGFASYGVGAADQESTVVQGNGDDAYALYFDGDSNTGAPVDIYGEIGVDGTGKDWEYEDGRAVRNAGIITPNSTWTIGEWTIFSDDPSNPNGIANVADMTPGVHPDPEPDPLADYLAGRGDAGPGDLENDVNGNGLTVLEEYLASFADGLGNDRVIYGINPDAGTTGAFTLTSDSDSIPGGITVVLRVTNDINVSAAVSAYTTNVIGPDGNGDYTIEFIETPGPGSPAITDKRFFFLQILEN